MYDFGTLLDDDRYSGIFLSFTSNDYARLALEQLRWPGGAVCCPVCGSDRPIYRQNRKGVAGYYRCPAPHTDKSPKGIGRPLVFTVRTGTIMERSHVPLSKWAYCLAIGAFAKANHPKRTLALSASKLALQIDVNPKTAASILRSLVSVRPVPS